MEGATERTTGEMTVLNNLELICFNCEGKGHIAFECKHSLKMPVQMNFEGGQRYQNRASQGQRYRLQGQGYGNQNYSNQNGQAGQGK